MPAATVRGTIPARATRWGLWVSLSPDKADISHRQGHHWWLHGREVSGEILRLLSILSDRSDGSTQYELTVKQGVSASLIYKAVMLDLVYAQRQSDEQAATFRYYLREVGRALLSHDERGSPRGD